MRVAQWRPSVGEPLNRADIRDQSISKRADLPSRSIPRERIRSLRLQPFVVLIVVSAHQTDRMRDISGTKTRKSSVKPARWIIRDGVPNMPLDRSLWEPRRCFLGLYPPSTDEHFEGDFAYRAVPVVDLEVLAGEIVEDALQFDGSCQVPFA
jgi:hypothetical protein